MAEGITHPRLTMDDITEVSSVEEIEKKNTITITKNTEARSKTVMAAIAGGVLGVIIFICLFSFVGIPIASAFIPLCILLVPFFAVGKVKDPTEQLRWRRAQQTFRSRGVEGNIFFPNSTVPEDIIHTKLIIIETPHIRKEMGPERYRGRW
ncbi:hypothetical protein [Bifidobacterium callitrichidarum]|uniref:hypothetical protein n=1 Tax=Bifidobacterium callitrichidarum TaxID=2052941 RepID=UPI00187E3FB5|nr:hypothetical protein [Bifidobacterium callitrichidarum]